MTTTPLRLAPPATGTDLRLRVASKDVVADGVVLVRLTHPDELRLPDWSPGAHIDIILPDGTARQYSLCGDRDDCASYSIGVLREVDGRGGSAYIHDELTVGDLVEVGGPRNNFRVVPSESYTFIAGGIGITPILAMIQQAEEVGADWRLLYGGRQRSSMAFLDRLAQYGRRVAICPQDECGLLDLASFTSGLSADARVYACGPAPLLAALERIAADWPPGMLRTERFVADEMPPPVRSTAFELELARSGQVVTVEPDASVLDALAAVGHPILSSCRRGLCGTCETAVLAGEIDHRDTILDDAERSAGDCMMTCVSRASSDRLVLDL